MLEAAANIKDKDEKVGSGNGQSIAEKVLQIAEEAMQLGQVDNRPPSLYAGQQLLRAAMFSLAPTDDRLNKFMTLSRETLS